MLNGMGGSHPKCVPETVTPEIRQNTLYLGGGTMVIGGLEHFSFSIHNIWDNPSH